MRLPRRHSPTLACAILLASFAAFGAAPCLAQSSGGLPPVWSDAAHVVAQKIAEAVTPNRTVSIDVRNITSSAPVDLTAIRAVVEQQIRVQGGSVVSISAVPPADVPVEVTVSKSIHGYLLVAQIPVGDTPRIAIVTVAQPGVPSRPSPEPVLHRKIVWQQSARIVDFAQTAVDASHTIWYILEPHQLVAHEFDGGSEILQVAQPISLPYSSRDPRGRIAATDPTHVTAWIATAVCDGSWNPSFSVECRPNVGEQWPMGRATWTFDPSRNNFSGQLTIANSISTSLPAFFSAASPLAQGSGQSASRWLVAELDGRAQLFGGSAGAVASFDNWGSDVASIAPACGSGWRLLVTGPGDWTQPDSIQLYEISGSRAAAMGQPLELPGPVLTLWTSSDGRSARVVSRNLRTGMYEASIVSPTCGD